MIYISIPNNSKDAKDVKKYDIPHPQIYSLTYFIIDFLIAFADKKILNLHLRNISPLDIRVERNIITFMELNMVSGKVSKTQPFEAQVQIFKVLTHPARLAILEILQDGEQCVCHMETHLGFRQAYISQQLSVLREAGIIQDRRDGWNIFYRVIDERIFDVLDAMKRITGQDKSELIKSNISCACPKCKMRRQTFKMTN